MVVICIWCLCFILSGSIYVIGGKNECGPLKSVEMYNLNAEMWSFVRNLDVAVFDHAGAPYKDRVVLVYKFIK